MKSSLFERFVPENRDVVMQSSGLFPAREEQRGKRVALKMIQVAQEGVPARILREISLLKSLRHPNIIQLIEVDYTPNISNNSLLVVVFEWADGNLCSKLGMDVPKAKHVLRQLAMALQYCHERGISHGNVQPKHILVVDDCTNNTIKLAHFASAIRSSTTTPLAVEVENDLGYVAPELLSEQQHQYYGCEADMWACGVCFVELIIGHVLWPSSGGTAHEALLQIFKALGSPPRSPEYFAPQPIHTLFNNVRMDEHDLELVQAMLTYNPRQRITASALLAQF